MEIGEFETETIDTMEDFVLIVHNVNTELYFAVDQVRIEPDDAEVIIEISETI